MTRDLRRVLVLSRNDYNRARSYAPELLVDPELKVIAVPARPPEDQDDLYRRLHGLLHPGTVLVHNLWRQGDYVEATVAHEELSVQKFSFFAGVCQRLGATRLEVTQIREVTEDGQESGKASLSVGAGAGSGSLTNATTVKVAGRLNARWSWSGGRPDAEEATRLARSTGLTKDQVVMGLIHQRAYDSNLLAEHHLELDLSSEAKREVQAAMHVQSIARKLGPAFDAGLEVLRHQTHNMRLSLTVAFS